MKRLGTLPKAAAWLITATLIFAAVFMIGGIKLNSKYNKIEKALESKVNSPDSSGITFASDYSRALGFAQSIEACADEILDPASNIRQQLKDAFAAAKNAEGNTADSYAALGELYNKVCTAYNAIEKKDEAAAKTVRGAYNNFLSGYTVIANSYGEAFNEYSYAVKELEGGFPSTVIKELWGID